MFSRKMKSAMRSGVGAMLALVTLTAVVHAQAREKIRIPVGRGEVVSSTEDVRTVAIAEPKIADATVGSAKTVVVTAKAPGITTLVVYNEGARYKVYDIEVYVPNGNKQVALHVRVAEVNSSATREIGLDWFGQGAGSAGFFQGGLYTAKVATPTIPLIIPPDAGAATDGLLHYGHSSGTWFLDTKWKALEEKGDLRTLANSTLMARSGEKAMFLSGGEIAIPISSGSSSGGSTVTIEWKEFGVKLNFTPTVEEDNSITLKVAPEVSQVDFSHQLTIAGFVVPTLISRKTSTTVNLNSGEHLVIGGLKQVDKVKSVQRIPVLGRIPLLGLLFTTQRTEDVERDLLVVVSPELVTAAAATLPALPTDRRAE